MGRQYSDMTIEELIDHALKYSSRISETDAVIELSQRVLSAQRALDAEREKVAKLEKIQAIDLKNNNEYREQLATLQAQLRQVEGERDNALESRDWWRAQLDKERAKLAATSQEGQHESR